MKVRAGLEDRPLLQGPEIGTAAGPVLFVVGSYVAKTSRQLGALLSSGRVEGIELQGDEGGPDRAAHRASAALDSGRHAAIYKSRYIGTGQDFLAVGASVMRGLCDAIRRITERPSDVVAKGGITSLEIARTALGARNAVVAGQVPPGVPLGKLGDGSLLPGIPYVVFPGNVGDDFALLEVLRRLRPA